MSLSSETKSFPCDAELRGKAIGVCNKLDALAIPTGVTIYISESKDFDIKKSLLFTEYLHRKQNDTFAPSVMLYMHTIGTSADDIELIITNVGQDGVYFENVQKGTLALENEIGQSITDNELNTQFLVDNLDKIINPYQDPILDNGSTTSTSATTMLDKTLTCDMIKITLSYSNTINITGIVQSGIRAIYNGVIAVNLNASSSTAGGNHSITHTFKNTSGKTLKIEGQNAVNGQVQYTLEEYTKKV